MAQGVSCTRASEDGTMNVAALILVFVVSLSLSLSSALAGAEIHQSVSVIFNGEKVNLPPGKSLHLCDTSTILSEEILHALEPFHAVYINRTFEDNDPDYVLVEGRDGILVEKPTLKGVYYLTFEDSASTARAVEDLRACQDVLAAHQNGMIGADAVFPNDDYFGSQWSLHNSGQSGGTPNADINAPEAWEYETGTTYFVKIGIIDSGVDGDHEDLDGRVYGDGPGVSDPEGDPYHGTWVAGIMAANTNYPSHEGIAGINWLSSLISENIFVVGWGEAQTKIVTAVDQGAEILNNSWHVPDGSLPPQLGKAFAYAYNMDVLCVASAGNDTSSGPHYPSDLQKLISVSATTRFDLPWAGTNWGSEIDIAAPGASIISTYNQSVPGWKYVVGDGTSASAPHVSGVASLLKSHNPTLWNDDIRRVMELSAKDLPVPGWDAYYGWGRLDAAKAFEILQAPNTLVREETGGGYVYSVSGLFGLQCYGIPGLTDGLYMVKRYEVRKDVTFPQSFWYVPAVWGRGAKSVGYMTGSPLFNFRHCEVVPGSVTWNGCTLRTYVYEVWTFGPDPQWRGFKPTSPGNAHFAYSILGEFQLLSMSSTTATPDFPNERCLIQWDDPNETELGHVIQAKVGASGVFWDYATVGANITSWYHQEIDTLVGSQTYFYRVRPFNEHQETILEGPSASFRNLPNPPSNINAYALTRPIGEGGGPSQRIHVQWSYPQNQLANSIAYYKAKIEYPNHSGVVEWKDSLYGTSTQFCATYPNEPVNITMYAVSNWDELGRSATAVQVQAGGYEAGCYVAQDPPGGGQNSTPPPGGELGKPALPTEFALSQNYPNPFNPNTSITVSIAEPSALKLTIINALGQQIRTVYHGLVGVGYHEFIWDGRDEHGNLVGSGLYFYRAEAGEQFATRKMILLK